MAGGKRLLHVLGSGHCGQWIVVHGHKHHPKLEYAQGSGDSPAILSAGSLCACIYSTLQTLARNEFHIVKVVQEEVERLGLVGRVFSWDWAFGDGWARARAGSGLPYQCGFGYRVHGKALASAIAAKVVPGFVDWSELCQQIPEIEFLVPQDMAKLFRHLKRDHRIEVLYVDGAPRQIGRF